MIRKEFVDSLPAVLAKAVQAAPTKMRKLTRNHLLDTDPPWQDYRFRGVLLVYRGSWNYYRSAAFAVAHDVNCIGIHLVKER